MANELKFDKTFLLSGIPQDRECTSFVKGSLVPADVSCLFVKSRNDTLELVNKDAAGRMYTVTNNPDATEESGIFGISTMLFSRTGQKQTFYAAPQTLLFDAVAVKGKQWLEYVKEAEGHEETKKAEVQLTSIAFTWEDLKPPTSSSNNQAEEDYRGFYEEFKAQKGKANAYVIPRGQFVVLHSAQRIDAKTPITVILDGKNKVNIETEVTDAVDGSAAVYYHPPGSNPPILPECMATVSIDMSGFEPKQPFWRKGGPAGKYELRALLRFARLSSSIEVAFVDITPISVEQALLLQFGNKYDGILETIAAKKLDEIRQDPGLKAFTIVKQVGEKVKETIEQAQELFDVEDKEGLINSWYTLIPEEVKPPLLDSAIKFAFSGLSNWNTYREFREKTKVAGALKDNLRLIARYTELKKDISGFRAWYMKSAIQNTLITNAVETLKETPEKWQRFLKKGECFAELQEFKGVKAIKDILKKPPRPELNFSFWVDAAFDSAEVIQSAWKFAESGKSVDIRRSQMKSIMTEYVQDYPVGGGIQVLAVLEGYRKAVVAARQGRDAAFFEMIGAVTNLAISLAAVFPPTAIAGEFILLGQGIAETLRDPGVKLIKELDYHVFKRAMLQKVKGLQEFFETRYETFHNTAEMNSEKGVDAVAQAHVQFRLRAEAITGLFELIQWAGYRFDEAGIKKFIADYKIKEYIETFILCRSDWIYPKKLPFPITLADYWLYKHSVRVKVAAAVVAAIAPGGSLAAIAFMIGKAAIPKTDSLHHRADFQKLFPIHYVDSGLSDDGLATLFSSFSLNYSTLSPDAIDCIFVYCRANDKEEWKPVWGYGNARVTVKQLTPLTQVRVCVILRPDEELAPLVKGGKRGIPLSFPIELQISKVKMLAAMPGPVYQKNSYLLVADAAQGLLTNEWEKEFIGAKRQGAVFYPFYEFDGLQLSGLKPFSASHTALEFAKTYPIQISASIPRSRAELRFSPPPNAAMGVIAPKVMEIPVKFNLQVTANNPKEHQELQWKMSQDRGFIEHTEATNTPVPPLTHRKAKIPGIFLKKGGSWVYFKYDKKKTIAYSKDYDFDWTKPFETVILLALEAGADAVCQASKAVDFRRYPLAVTMMQSIEMLRDGVTNAFDPVGPSYVTNFHYLGQVNLEGVDPKGLQTTSLEPEKKPIYNAIDSFEVKQILPMLPKAQTSVETPAAALDAYYMKYDDFTPYFGKYALYAGHIRFSYDIKQRDNTIATINAFRPFGRLMKGDQYYYIKIDNQAGVDAVCEVLFSTPKLASAVLPAQFDRRLLNDKMFMEIEAKAQVLHTLRSTAM